MIEQQSGWSWELRENGVFLTPRASDGGAYIRYVERVRPLRPLREVARALPELRGRSDVVLSAPERLVTKEGEYAAVITGSVTAGGRRMTLAVGCVYLDDFYSLVAGVSARSDHDQKISDKVRQLVHGDRHILGVRRRRFVYQAPQGWSGVFMPPFHAYYVGPTHRKHTLLSVLPAVPDPAQGIAARLLQSVGAPEDFDLASGQSVATDGLHGTIHAIEGPERCAYVVVLTDQRYSYPIVLTTIPQLRDEHLEVLRTLVQTVEAIPGAGVAQASSGESPVLNMWDE